MQPKTYQQLMDAWRTRVHKDFTPHPAVVDDDHEDAPDHHASETRAAEACYHFTTDALDRIGNHLHFLTNGLGLAGITDEDYLAKATADHKLDWHHTAATIHHYADLLHAAADQATGIAGTIKQPNAYTASIPDAPKPPEPNSRHNTTYTRNTPSHLLRPDHEHRQPIYPDDLLAGFPLS